MDVWRTAQPGATCNASRACPVASINGPVEFLTLCNEFALGHSYFDNDPKRALRNLGLEEADFTVSEPWDQFPVARRYLEIWEATERYVDAVVDATYASDFDVVRDAALRRWICATRHPWGGNVRGFPHVNSRQVLKEVLSSYLYRITVHGMSRFDVTVHPALSFASNFPPCLQKRTIPRPETPLSTKELLQYLPTTDTLGKYVDFLYFFIYSEPYERFVPDDGIDRELFFPGGLADPRNDALVRYRLDILSIAAHFDPTSVRLHPEIEPVRLRSRFVRGSEQALSKNAAKQVRVH